MKRALAILLALLMMILPVSCNKDDGNTQGDTPDTPTTVRIWSLNGTTGFGLAGIHNAVANGTASLDYQITFESDATNVRDGLINGTVDIGALPTNVASAVYKATNGGVQIIAINTLGVLYLVANTTDGAAAPTALSDLSGKTIFCPAQNPTFITNALIAKAEVTGITVDSTTYATPALLRDAIASGLVDYAVLPEPMVTAAKTKAAKAGETLVAALDFTAEWNKYFPEGSLVQGCVVARKAFIEANPDAITTFLADYAATIAYNNEHPEEAGAMIAAAGLMENATLAANVLPRCNICCITGEAMKAAMETFLAAMPLASIGGELPSAGFYYGT